MLLTNVIVLSHFPYCLSIVQLYKKRAVDDGEWFCSSAGRLVKEKDSRF